MLCPGFDFVQAVVLLFGSKATLHAGCPFFTELCCYNQPVIFMLSCSAFEFEVRDDLLSGTPLPVGIGSIDVSLLLLLQVLGPGSRYLQMLAGSLHLALHPVNTFPDKLHVGWVTHVGFIAGRILQNDVWILYIRLPSFSCVPWILSFRAISVLTLLMILKSDSFSGPRKIPQNIWYCMLPLQSSKSFLSDVPV